ncbi:MAG TPA: hypothetical protein VHU81_19930 [Thermoanaerobaculia bacterium]|nr:hypothetical protein [Thermoanaerobaculia bacterium]
MTDPKDSTFVLEPGVQLAPLGDGSAVLYSKELDQSLSLNHTAALLCSFADGHHTVSEVLQEMSQVFPDSAIPEQVLVDCLNDLQARHFLRWS